MPDCSLCGNPLNPEGGKVLFTDTSGVPFEVCGECEKRFIALQALHGGPDAEAALDYIARNAKALRRSEYDELMGYVGELPAAIPWGGPEDLKDRIDEIREAKRRETEAARKPGKAVRLGRIVRRVLLTILGLFLLAALICLVYAKF